MDRADIEQRLSRMTTRWSLVVQAHAQEGGDTVTVAQKALLLRYGGAVLRYLSGAVRDADAAEELCQEFAVRFLRGDFHRADPKRGRFRDYLKTALIHLAADYHARRKAAPRPLAAEVAQPAPLAGPDSERDFLASWREELLQRTWSALAADNITYHAALRLRVEAPDMTSAEMANQLTTQLGRPISAALVRKTLQRAQDKFADLLLDEVGGTLEGPSLDEVEAELAAVDLLRFCRSALQRRRV
jgi:RNA polymerase sigma-70 factor (ECF subfamily)